MIYLLLKALHVAAVIAWMTGMLLLSLSLSLMEYPCGWLRRVLAWNRRVTTPAMLVSWTLGIAMATEAHWFHAHWLQLKLAVVAALSVLHGYQSGLVRRIADEDGARVPDGGHTARLMPWITILAVVIIAALAVAKPL
jgi:protoporphyrinogen IX oxidase